MDDLTQFRFETGPDGIATLVWDAPGQPENLVTAQTIAELEAALARLTRDAAIAGCIIMSGKDSFCGGVDLGFLENLVLHAGDPKQAGAFSRLCRTIETCGKPVAIAIQRACIGAGFELALACHYRVMGEDGAFIGLPDTRLGLLPGGGLVQRLARIMPAGQALRLLFGNARRLGAADAKAASLVHETAPGAELVERARAAIKAGLAAKPLWDDPFFTAPADEARQADSIQDWAIGQGLYRSEIHDHYPAARMLIEALDRGPRLPFEDALEIERSLFATALAAPETAAMLRTALAAEALSAGARRPKGVAPGSVERVGILGAGFMGAGIAYVAAAAGIETVLVDVEQAFAERGRALCARLAAAEIFKGEAAASARDALLARITPSADYAALADCQLVIESVFEEHALKVQALHQAEAVMRADAILASNTSSLPISSLADAVARPQDFVGLHFFSPVEKMQLVEIIRGAKSSELAIAVAFDFVRAIGKTPILVNDGREFYANRCVNAYLREGHLMLLEGIAPATIEAAGRDAGMPVGPLALSDEVAIDLVYKILLETKKALGADAIDTRQERLLEAIVVTHGRHGRKNARGFYDYPETGPKILWKGLGEFADQTADAVDPAHLRTRFLAIQALEAIHAMEEGIVEDPREADAGSVLGFGFAPFTGGTLSYVDAMGSAAFLALCEQLAADHGARFAPPQLLRDLAASGACFHRRFGLHD